MMRALVTGGAQGLGRALADQLLREGHHVTIVDIDRQGLHDLTQSNVGQCESLMIDMADLGALRLLTEGSDRTQFDLVILNAGISATGKFEDIPADAYEKLIKINARAPMIIASSLMRGGRVAKKGKIVFISSLSHAVGYPGAAVYAATKDAIAIYAKSVRKPFAKRGVGVLTVFPGPIRTAHAEKHAPPGANAQNRMAPEKLAQMILKAARGSRRELYPGFTAWIAAFAGRQAPGTTIRAMKKHIFDKLQGPTV